MSKESSKQANQTKSSTYPLVGNEHFTEAERADFLAQARQQESEYDRYVNLLKRNSGINQHITIDHYPHEVLPDMFSAEHRLHDYDHPVYLKTYIAADDAHIKALTDELNKFGSGRDEKSARDFFESRLSQIQERMNFNKAKLEAYYEANPHKRAEVTSMDAAEVKQDELADKKASGQGWHKQRVDAHQPLQFTEAFKRTNTIQIDYKAIEFKPYEGDRDSLRGVEALYTNGQENKHLDPSPKNIHLHPYQQPISESHIKHASKYALLAMGLVGAAEAAESEPGDLLSKLNTAKEVLKETALEAVPGVTFFEKMRAGKYQEASLDAASYLPLGDITAFSRTPEVQAVIESLPKTTDQLQAILSDQYEAPINKHMAEYQLRLMEAKDSGDVLKGLAAIDELTELAEKKLIMQVQWSKKAADYAEAVETPDPHWPAIIKRNPEIAPQIAIHVAAVNSGRPQEFVEQIDANITSALAAGRLLTPTLSLGQLKNSASFADDSTQMQALESCR